MMGKPYECADITVWLTLPELDNKKTDQILKEIKRFADTLKPYRFVLEEHETSIVFTFRNVEIQGPRLELFNIEFAKFHCVIGLIDQSINLRLFCGGE